MQYKTIVLVDGENLVQRYQSLVQAGRVPIKTVDHERDCFVWQKDILNEHGNNDVVRVSYYTTVVGDDNKIYEIKRKISESIFEFTTISSQEWSGTLVPYVFKKEKQNSKSKSVDINLTIDALKYAYGTSIDKVVIMSGDGDYIPLLREVMSRGKMVQVYAFSDGLNKEIFCNVDDLFLLDDLFFEPND
ncbi:NYN domain-containing protein [Chitinibacter fontanus]|uniref:NYN domain-containing protein n=1 Tax=Chitinibacter fontanus TaxID=1737446 RepID=A0A7D5ZFF3_9NEIS|nr:NYN domain-containing protein [Chitinibacter fontanus]QLI80767.1 NYN domain-containing protein [Chitinibacter fontanus]